MKFRLFNLILATTMSVLCLGLLIFVAYSWYVNSNNVNATNINFSSKDGGDTGYTVTIVGTDGRIISAPLLPDEITMLEVSLDDTSEREIEVSLTPKLEYKEVVRDTNNLITKIKTVTDDPNGILDSITKITDIDKYYLVDEYYTYTTNDNVITLGDKAYNLTDAEKQEIFTSFYEKYNYSLITKIKYFIADEIYPSTEYKTALIDKINTDFINLKDGLKFSININTPNQNNSGYVGKKYIYFYFDPTDEIFPYGLNSTDTGYNSNLINYCFYGQNPYFYQTIKFEVLTTSN